MSTKNRVKIAEVKPPAGNLVLYTNDDTRLIYADGISQFMMRGATTRLDFYVAEPAENKQGISVAGAPDGPAESRLVTHHVIVPTKNLIEALAAMFKQLTGEKDNILQGFEAENKRLKEILDGVHNAGK